jgi:DNA-binding response OmpR family regulator
MNAAALGGPILIVEDDPNIAALVETYLGRAGFETLVAHDGREGLELARSRRPAFVILDLMLPGIDGWDLCRELRRVSDIPILMLTAREEEMDRVVGLSMGADDYVVKPFSPRELVERVKAILRRTGPRSRGAALVLRHRDLTLDPERHKVTLSGKPVSLTPSEYTILHTLMRAPGRVFSRDELLNHLYPRGEVVIDRVIDVHVGKLRQKIEAEPGRPSHVVTVRGVGYRFAESEPD